MDLVGYWLVLFCLGLGCSVVGLIIGVSSQPGLAAIVSLKLHLPH